MVVGPPTEWSVTAVAITAVESMLSSIARRVAVLAFNVPTAASTTIAVFGGRPCNEVMHSIRAQPAPGVALRRRRARLQRSNGALPRAARLGSQLRRCPDYSKTGHRELAGEVGTHGAVIDHSHYLRGSHPLRHSR